MPATAHVRAPSATATESPRWQHLTPGLLLTAGVLHLALLQAHLAEARGLGLYFCAIGAGQIVWSLLHLRKPTRATAATGLIAFAVAPVTLYVMTRLLRAPWGDGPEETDFVGVATTLMEAAAAVLLALRLPPPRGEGIVETLPSGTYVATAILVGIVLGGATYGAALGAEALVPWLGESEGNHHASGAQQQEPGHHSVQGSATGDPLETGTTMQGIAGGEPNAQVRVFRGVSR